MSAVTAAGCGMPPPMSAKESRRLRLWLSVSPTLRVGVSSPYKSVFTNRLDANLFKEAFLKAQQENEALFKNSEEA